MSRVGPEGWPSMASWGSAGVLTGVPTQGLSSMVPRAASLDYLHRYSGILVQGSKTQQKRSLLVEAVISLPRYKRVRVWILRFDDRNIDSHSGRAGGNERYFCDHLRKLQFATCIVLPFFFFFPASSAVSQNIMWVGGALKDAFCIFILQFLWSPSLPILLA